MTDGSGGGRRPATEAPPTKVRHIRSETEAAELARWLTTHGRRWPVALLTIPGEHREPFGDPDQVKDALGDLAEVVVMPTSDVSWAFSRQMPPGTQVYGGAGRVYPVDHAWITNPQLSRLRFAYSDRDRERITQQLIQDALAAALAAGLVDSGPGPQIRRRTGRVMGVIGIRALVELDDRSTATVWEELTVPGVPLDRLVVKDQRVTGAFDPLSRRLDLRESLRYVDPAVALTGIAEAYRVGDVVLADVAEVADEAVTLRLLPGASVTVGREAVTTNPADALSGLFTPGEVVTCRIVSLTPPRLRLDDIDDDETHRPAPALLPDGPPWLCQPEPQSLTPAPTAEVTREATPQTASRPAAPAGRPGAPPVPAARRPTPLDLPGRHRNGRTGPISGAPTRAPAHPASAPEGPALAAERQRVRQLRNELEAERATRKGLATEADYLRARADELETELAAARQTIRDLQTRYRKADQNRQRAAEQLRAAHSRLDRLLDPEQPAFADPVAQFRHEVYCEWVRRIPAAEKAAKPLAEYQLLPGFLESIDHLEGISRSKIVAVVVEVLTGQVAHLDGRELHQLRSGSAGSPYVTRHDGATCWRVALQRGAPAARRLHYWRSAVGYEFSRVALHDDYRP